MKVPILKKIDKRGISCHPSPALSNQNTPRLTPPGSLLTGEDRRQARASLHATWRREVAEEARQQLIAVASVGVAIFGILAAMVVAGVL